MEVRQTQNVLISVTAPTSTGHNIVCASDLQYVTNVCNLQHATMFIHMEGH